MHRSVTTSGRKALRINKKIKAAAEGNLCSSFSIILIVQLHVDPVVQDVIGVYHECC